MVSGGRSRAVALALLTAGAVAAAGGCSKLQASLDRRDTVTLGDVAARVAALEQRVADLESGQSLQTQGPTGSPNEAQQAQAPRLDANRIAQGTQAVVTAKILNVRAQPDTKSTRVGQLREGAVVQVTAVEGDWAKIQFGRGEGGVAGWVSTQFIQRQE